MVRRERSHHIYLSNMDQKRKPTMVELEALRRYSDITLCPGDVLYIPRGHIHNAPAIVFDNRRGATTPASSLPAGLSSESSSSDCESRVMMRRRRRWRRRWLDLDNCPSYPKGMPLVTRWPIVLTVLVCIYITFGLLQAEHRIDNIFLFLS
jgi:hypothetical protein